jgi:3-oxoadipate enol-lactonase
MPRAELSGAEIRYSLDGPADAPVLVLSNSLGTDLHMWDKVVRGFSERFRVLRYDTRGHGESSVSEPPYTVSQLAQDLVRLLDHLHLDRVNLCGLSLGGITAMWLAIHEPSRFEKLIFANTSPRITSAKAWNERIAFVRASGMHELAKVTMPRWFTADFLASNPNAVDPLISVIESTSPDGYIGCCAALGNKDLWAEVNRIQAPSLVITGEFDVATPAADGQALHNILSNSHYVELKAGHLSAWERPHEFQSAVLGFLAQPAPVR